MRIIPNDQAAIAAPRSVTPATISSIQKMGREGDDPKCSNTARGARLAGWEGFVSLRARILSLALAASLLPMLAILWLLLDNREATTEQAHQRLSVRAQAIANELDDRIAGTAQLLFGLARVPLVGGNDKAACSDFLADVLKAHPQYTGLLTIRPDGQLHCDSLRSGRTLNLTDRNYFQRALTANAPVIEPAIGRLTGKAVLQIAYPVRKPGGALHYVLLASLDMQAYGETIATALPYPRMNFQVWNQDGSVVMDYPAKGAVRRPVTLAERSYMLASDTGRTQTLGEGQQAHIWVNALLPRTREPGLRLALSVPHAELYRGIDRQFQHAVSSLLAMGALVFLFAAALGEFAVRRQTAHLMQAISRLDQGQFNHPIGAPYPRGELGQVMAALDRMTASMAQQQQVIRSHTELLEHQASIDALTGLANRNLLTDRLNHALIYARRAHRVAAVLMLDLDRFKTVNDSLGHSQGDLLLQTVANRLLSCVREGDTVARLGGDEFVIVLTDMADASDVVPVAQKILSALAQPVELGRQVLSVTTSLGIAVYPRDGTSADTLLQHADTAMYRAKDQGGHAMAFFTADMMQATIDRLRVEAGLRRALAEGELRLHFQPIVDAATGRIHAAEALVRWMDPERGLVMPGQFIAIAEETGLIGPMGEWVLREACAQALSWQAQGLGAIPVAVNLSPRQFSDPALAHVVTQALQHTHCPPDLLQLEITESMIMERPDDALRTMHQLQALGIVLSVDDFGTGYSSLSHLKRFPVSKLKIDRAFVRDLCTDPHDAVIVDAVVTLARKLGLSTVAEGVETIEQQSMLKQLGCDQYQGYLFAKPCTAAEFEQLVRRHPLGGTPGHHADFGRPGDHPPSAATLQ